MSEKIELREVSVESDLFKNQLQPSRVNMIAQVGEPARVEMEVNLVTNEKLATKSDEDLQELLDLNKDYQTQAFQVDTASEATINVSDNILGDGGNNLSFRGFISAPGFQIAPGTFNAKVSAVHEDVRMENFNASIYASDGVAFGSTRANRSGSGMRLLDENFSEYIENGGATDSIADQIIGLLDASVDAQNMSPNDFARVQAFMTDKGHHTAQLRLAQQIHEKNQGRTDFIKSFLARSKDTINLSDPSSGLDLIQPLTANRSEDIAERSIYTHWMSNSYGQSKNFYSYLLSTICPAFLLEYVCNFYEGGSYIEHPQVNSEIEKEVEIMAKSINYSLASRYQKALGQVVTSSRGVPIWGDGNAKGSGARMAGWPNPASPEEGRYIQTEGPPWFKGTQYHKDQNYIAEIEGPRNPEAAADEAFEDFQDVVDREAAEKPGFDFLEAWSKKQYNLWALKNTNANFEVPLNVAWGGQDFPIGRRYSLKVKNPTGAAPIVMRGYLNRVIHTMDVNADSSTGTAQTTLDFTHIKTPGFVLPGDA